MGLHITVGYDGQGTAARSTVIYCGHSKTDALAAEARSNAVRFERLSNVSGVRKSNPAHDPKKPCFPAEDPPAEALPAEDTPAEDTPAEDTPAEDTPAEDTPAEDTPAHPAPRSLTGKHKRH